MLTIRLCYENDRFTPEPKYVDGLPLLWWLEFSGATDNDIINDWMSEPRAMMTHTQIEDEVVALGEKLGIKDSTSKEEWEKHGIVVKAPSITGFVNWPDPSFSG